LALQNPTNRIISAAMAKSFNPSDTILNKAGVNDHPQSGWLGFPAVGRKNKRTLVRNHCVCDRVRSTRSVYKQPPGLENPIAL
jgi:hypothetical protein